MHGAFVLNEFEPAGGGVNNDNVIELKRIEYRAPRCAAASFSTRPSSSLRRGPKPLSDEPR